MRVVFWILTFVRNSGMGTGVQTHAGTECDRRTFPVS